MIHGILMVRRGDRCAFICDDLDHQQEQGRKLVGDNPRTRFYFFRSADLPDTKIHDMRRAKRPVRRAA